MGLARGLYRPHSPPNCKPGCPCGTWGPVVSPTCSAPCHKSAAWQPRTQAACCRPHPEARCTGDTRTPYGPMGHGPHRIPGRHPYAHDHTAVGSGAHALPRAPGDGPGSTGDAPHARAHRRPLGALDPCRPPSVILFFPARARTHTRMRGMGTRGEVEHTCMHMHVCLDAPWGGLRGWKPWCVCGACAYGAIRSSGQPPCRADH